MAKTARKLDKRKTNSGRTARYNSNYHPKIAAICAKHGMVDEEIANELGVSERTLNYWKKKYPELLQSLKGGKSTVDKDVEEKLLSRALGYSYKETVKGKSEKQGAFIRETERQMAPDVTACIFWLKNRMREKWKDSKDITIENFDEMKNAARDIFDED